ncbi:hypothetical protein GUITHDRAFT_112228 [Guillardia theta CCMP2712]|uniref:Bestrophin homolog n=1 Tax=Guillardia theta (strain CCMP2712) TaxID=905079 RepID=L1J015_GUITC|nr:hypothetical protein GUITHDRAFT_112228 [Guillardia theta CCMP2712]EKX41811.1 hypothetical protein GUITHDRAFT_112228 [Guillardia theta CCMP2712]|eukprot:XP_005828791.1 hypothetical protein GUITHDRAFT_112228 [Guillardia theta CCMP2712]
MRDKSSTRSLAGKKLKLIPYKRTRARGTSTEFLVEELTTDDGLLLSGGLLLEARSNWVRDLMSTGRSLLLRRIADRLGFIGLWSVFVSLLFAFSPDDWHVHEVLKVPEWPHELVGGFLSILLVFRTDQAYQRFWEGRERWADVAAHLRTMTRITVTAVEPRSQDAILSHLCAFPITLKQHLRGERSGSELEPIFDAFNPNEVEDGDEDGSHNIQNILGANNMPLTLLTSLSSQAVFMAEGSKRRRYMSISSQIKVSSPFR